MNCFDFLESGIDRMSKNSVLYRFDAFTIEKDSLNKEIGHFGGFQDFSGKKKENKNQ